MAATQGAKLTPQPLPFEVNFHHFGISVPKLQPAIDWYCKMLGFEVEQQFSIDVIPADIVILRRGNLHIEVFEVPNSVPASEDRRNPDLDVRTHGMKHIGFTVKGVAALVDEFKQRGVDIVFFKENGPIGGHVYIRDNNGNLLEFIEA